MLDRWKIKKSSELELFKMLFLEERSKNEDLLICLDYLKQENYYFKSLLEKNNINYE